MVQYSVPPSNSLVSRVLRASRERGLATRLLSSGTALIVLSIRLETRRASFSLGSSARMLAGAMWMLPPIQLSAICVFIICEATMVTTRLQGCSGDRHRIGSRAKGVRSVWYLPGSAAPVSFGIRWYSSAH